MLQNVLDVMPSFPERDTNILEEAERRLKGKENNGGERRGSEAPKVARPVSPTSPVAVISDSAEKEKDSEVVSKKETAGKSKKDKEKSRKNTESTAPSAPSVDLLGLANASAEPTAKLPVAAPVLDAKAQKEALGSLFGLVPTATTAALPSLPSVSTGSLGLSIGKDPLPVLPTLPSSTTATAPAASGNLLDTLLMIGGGGSAVGNTSTAPLGSVSGTTSSATNAGSSLAGLFGSSVPSSTSSSAPSLMEEACPLLNKGPFDVCLCEVWCAFSVLNVVFVQIAYRSLTGRGEGILYDDTMFQLAMKENSFEKG